MQNVLFLRLCTSLVSKQQDVIRQKKKKTGRAVKNNIIDDLEKVVQIVKYLSYSKISPANVMSGRHDF